LNIMYRLSGIPYLFYTIPFYYKNLSTFVKEDRTLLYKPNTIQDIIKMDSKLLKLREMRYSIKRFKGVMENKCEES
ncbi:MAG: hypothetical protein KAR54_04360, partial [Candidatus Pacebacteria bacterium]|nr:hypothetical protein [Candidatus Paceibacterota bacterium]